MGNHKILKTSGENSRYSMYEFIAAIKSHPILWDRGHENFHSRELREQAWLDVGRRICKNFLSANENEKNEIAKTLHKRWKNTRDSYLRVCRLRQSEGDTSRSSYIYEKELGFLLDCNELPKIINSTDTLQQETKSSFKRILQTTNEPIVKHQKYSEQKNSDNYDDMSSDVNNIVSNTYTLEDLDISHSEVSGPLSKKYETNITATLDHNPSASNISTAIVVPADPDQAFFDSIKPYMQKMTDDMKLDFQIEVLKLLRNFKSK